MRPSRSGPTHTAVGSSVLVVAALVAHLPGFFRQIFDPDEAAIATMGMVFQRGGTLYRDVIDRKPPLAPLLYALSFDVTGGRDLRALHLVAALELGLAAVVLAYGARRVAGAAAGWWAGGLLVTGAVALSPTSAQAANYSHLALLPACGAIVAARSGSRRSALLAGALLGVATLTRQSWVVGLLPAAYAAWWWGGRRWSHAATLVTAFAATVAAVALVVPFGAFWHWTFAANGSVLAVGQSRDVLFRGLGAVALFAGTNVATWRLAVWRGWQRADLDLWLWTATGVAAFAAGFRFFGHYWLQVLPPLCLLAGLAISRVRVPRRALLVSLAAVPALVAWGAAFVPAVDRHGDVTPLIRYVEAHSRPNDLVTVWGSAPEVYWRSGRDPGGALVVSDFVVGRSAGRADGPQRLADATPGARQDMLAALERRPPVLFLDTSTAGLRSYGHYPLSRVPPIERFVRSRYRKVAVVDGTTVYRLVTTPPARPPT